MAKAGDDHHQRRRGVKPTERDKLWTEIVDRRPVARFEALTRGAGALVTTSSILMAGHLALVAILQSAGTKPGFIDWLPSLIWLAATGISTAALLPRKWRIEDEDCFEDIEDGWVAMCNRLAWYLRASSALTVLGVVAALALAALR